MEEWWWCWIVLRRHWGVSKCSRDKEDASKVLHCTVLTSFVISLRPVVVGASIILLPSVGIVVRLHGGDSEVKLSRQVVDRG